MMMSRADLLLEPDVKSRVGRIVVLLDHWQDFFETSARDDGPSGDGGVYLLPGMSRHPSVVELGRALGQLWLFAPGCSAHLFAYFAAPIRNTDRRRRVKSKGKFHVVDERVRARVLPSWIQEKRVVAGVRFVAQEPLCESCRLRSGDRERGCAGCASVALIRPWCYKGEVFLPAPLLESYPGEANGGKVAA
jgi:hypothetical protein